MNHFTKAAVRLPIMAEVRFRRLALQDLVRIERLIREDDADRAHRFRLRSRNSIEKIASTPYLGSPLHHHDEKNQFRWFFIEKFRMYVVIYLPMQTGIDVLRILHVSQDRSAALSGP